MRLHTFFNLFLYEISVYGLLFCIASDKWIVAGWPNTSTKCFLMNNFVVWRLFVLITFSTSFFFIIFFLLLFGWLPTLQMNRCNCLKFQTLTSFLSHFPNFFLLLPRFCTVLFAKKAVWQYCFFQFFLSIFSRRIAVNVLHDSTKCMRNTNYSQNGRKSLCFHLGNVFIVLSKYSILCECLEIVSHYLNCAVKYIRYDHTMPLCSKICVFNFLRLDLLLYSHRWVFCQLKTWQWWEKQKQKRKMHIRSNFIINSISVSKCNRINAKIFFYKFHLGWNLALFFFFRLTY